MTISNILTIGRIILTPILFLTILIGNIKLSLALYAIGIFTDAIDGKIARFTQTTSIFGRTMDSVADKAFVASAMLGLLANQVLSPVIVFAFVFREFLVIGIRAIKTPSNSTIAEINDRLGRIRFFILHIGILSLLIANENTWLSSTGFVAIWIALIMAYIVFLHYIKNHSSVLFFTMKPTSPKANG